MIRKLKKYQQGGSFRDQLFPENKPVVDQGNFSKVKYTPAQKAAMQNANLVRKNEEKKKLQDEIAARQSKEKGTPYKLPTGVTKKYKDMTLKERAYVDAQSLRNKGRWNENSVEQPFLNMFNPVTILYDMAAGLGEAPLTSDVSNSYMPYLTGVGVPLLTGALSGIGAKTTGQFVNNLANPLAGTGQIIDNIGNKYLPNAYKYNPWAFKPNPENIYRGIGKGGMEDAFQSGVIRNNPNKFSTEGIRSGLENGNFRSPYFVEGKDFNIAERYANGYIAETPLVRNVETGDLAAYPAGDNWGWTGAEKEMPLKDFNILKKDWLRGYKEVPKPTSVSSSVDDVGRGFKSDVGSIDYRKNPLSDKEREMYQWFDEQMRFDKLPQTTNKQSIEVLDNFKQRIRTPEGQKRLKELGITEEQLLQDLKIVEDPNTYGYYRSAKNTIAMNPNHPLPKKVVRHEIEHGVQNALRQSKINKVIDGTPAEKLKALESTTTEIDDILSGLTLRREGTPDKKWIGKAVSDKPVQIDDYKALINNKQNATDYFLTGSDGAEKSAFLGEVQQYMMDTGKIPKGSYVQITPEMVKETMMDAMFDEAGGGKYLRLFNIIKADPKNYEIISKGLNKMLSITPYIGIGGAGVLGAGALQQNKYGGPIITNRGQWDYPGQTTIIPSNKITMQGVPYPVIGVDNTGHTKMMQPGMDYTFPGQYVTEYPIMQQGGVLKDPTMESLSNVYAQRNRNLPWVDRALNPQNYPINNQQKFMDNGQPMTHQLSWGEDDDYMKFYVYPNIGYSQGNLEWNNNQQPIEFKSKKMAEYFSKNGLIKHYQQGGTKQNPPKVYTDKKKFEQAQRMYSDSLNLYNSGEDYYNRLKKLSFDTKGIGVSEENLKKAREENYKKYPWDKLNMPVSNYKSGSKFKPLSRYDIYVSDIGNIESNRYKKPVQPVVYQPSQSHQLANRQSSGVKQQPVVYKPNTHPIQKMNRLPMLPYLTEDSDITMNSGQINFPAPIVQQPKGKPVYGPGNTIIGYNNNMHFTPALQYTGAPNNVSNLQDKALLENPDALRQYVSRLDNYRFDKGGIYSQALRGIYSQGLNNTINGLNQFSYLSKNSPDNAMRDYYMNMSNYDSQNNNLYSTNQDLYGQNYFQDGGSYEELSNEYNDLREWQDLASMDGDNELYEYLTPDVNRLENSLKSMEDLARFDAMKEDLQRQILQQPQFQEPSIEGYNPRRPFTSNYESTDSEPMMLGTKIYPNMKLKGSPRNVKAYLTQKGLSRNAIAGIMGNIEHESSFNPGIGGDQGTSFGLFQHHATRKNNLLSYLKKRNLPSTNIEGQIDFALSEYPQLVKKLNKATSPQQAADIWVREFERPANVDKQSKLRQKSALKYMQQGGTTQNPPKIYTDKNQFEQAQRMYNDSLILYKSSKGMITDLKLINKLPGAENIWLKYANNWYDKNAESVDPAFNRLKKANKIAPVGKGYIDPKFPGSYAVEYKKPVQPVKYQPQPRTNTQKSKITSNKDLLNLKLPSGDVPRYANGQPVYTKPQTINTTQGKVTGTVKPHVPTHPITNLKKLSMSTQYLDNPNIQMQGQTIPLPEMRLPQQGNIPFYGPGNTIIGYTDANRRFYPAQQYTGAVNNQINLQDKELLNNPELLKKYVQSKDTYKFQLGGYTFPQYNYQQVRILPFLKKYK
jgi:hypothetical protein